MENKIVRILLKNYTKISRNGGIAKVIFDDRFEDIAEEIVKLFDIPVVSNCLHEDNFPINRHGDSQCTECGKVISNLDM